MKLDCFNHCVRVRVRVRVLISGGFRDYGARGRNHLRGPCLKIFCFNQDYSSCSFSLKLLCLKGVFKCFLVISFQFFLGAGPLLGYQKGRAWGHGPPGSPLKLPLVLIQLKVEDPSMNYRCLYIHNSL